MDHVSNIQPLGRVWPTRDPFLFCVHHLDGYPAGTADMGIEARALVGRDLGQDFSGKDGWNMYHGRTVPGFPRHPHRGFETVSVVRQGVMDHADSLGARARFGAGDVQWMTAGQGIVHSEMFPLLATDRPNPLELFQIWLNLPRAAKMVPPHFTMLWAHRIPRRTTADPDGRETRLTVFAGTLHDLVAPPPPPDSWAARADAHVVIATLALEPGARFTLEPAPQGARRSLYFFAGDTVHVPGLALSDHACMDLDPDRPTEIQAGERPVELLLLQGRPIGEPVVAHGPFVMGTQREILEAFTDFQRTGFGGWPWPEDGPVHGRDQGRFAIHADGRVEHMDERSPLPGAATGPTLQPPGASE